MKQPFQASVLDLRFRDARPQIAALITKPTYPPQALDAWLREHRSEWRFPHSFNAHEFLTRLEKAKFLRELVLERDSSSGPASYPDQARLLIRPKASTLDVAVGLRKDSFLSHLSAASLHGLTDLVPKVVYASREQSPKPHRPTAPLAQSAIDGAFSKPARATGRKYSGKRHTVILLEPKHSGMLEVEQHDHPVTSIERTLIECAVRPIYAGGIHEVLNIYEAARDRVSLRRLRKVLRELDYIYPYHQAIGFLLERAGYPDARLKAFAEPAFENDFYVDYAMPEPEHNSRWRIYHPRGF